MYTNKAGKAGLNVREGSVTFFRSSRFSLLDQRCLTLKHLFPAEVGGRMSGRAGQLAACADIWSMHVQPCIITTPPIRSN